MIAFLRCHYAYLQALYKQVSALSHNKILYLCNCHATTTTLIFFVSCENELHQFKRSRDLRCITPGIASLQAMPSV